MDLGNGLGVLSYSTLVHSGDTWAQLKDSLVTFVPQVRKRVCPDGPFGVSLRLSGAAARQLAGDPAQRAWLRDFLGREGLYVYTVNAFPHGPFKGRHYDLAETRNFPPALSRPRPQILIGGGGEKKTLLLVARYADACNLFGSSPDDIAHKLDVLRAHCETEGRDYDSITKTVLAMQPGMADVDAFVAGAEAYAKLGVTEIEVMPGPGQSPVEYATQLAERVAPRVLAI